MTPVANRISFRGTKAQLKALIRSLPAAAAGTGPDPLGLGAGVRAAVATEALAAIAADFDAKSAGGVGADGITWEPLKPETVAYSRTPKLPGGPFGMLTAGQRRLWKAVYARTLARARLALGEGEARALAGKVAWAAAKRAGAVTKLEAHGKRKVPIGVASGTLRASLDEGGPGNVCRVGEREVEVGSSVPHFGRFHRRRPVWPAAGVPRSWWRRIAGAAGAKLREAVERLAGG